MSQCRRGTFLLLVHKIKYVQFPVALRVKELVENYVFNCTGGYYSQQLGLFLAPSFMRAICIPAHNLLSAKNKPQFGCRGEKGKKIVLLFIYQLRRKRANSNRMIFLKLYVASLRSLTCIRFGNIPGGDDCPELKFNFEPQWIFNATTLDTCFCFFWVSAIYYHTQLNLCLSVVVIMNILYQGIRLIQLEYICSHNVLPFNI